MNTLVTSAVMVSHRIKVRNLNLNNYPFQICAPNKLAMLLSSCSVTADEVYPPVGYYPPSRTKEQRFASNRYPDLPLIFICRRRPMLQHITTVQQLPEEDIIHSRDQLRLVAFTQDNNIKKFN